MLLVVVFLSYAKEDVHNLNMVCDVNCNVCNKMACVEIFKFSHHTCVG